MDTQGELRALCPAPSDWQRVRQGFMDTRTENNDVRPSRLLVVDDEDLLGRTLCTYFTAKGHEVVTCTSGQEALARPDLQGFDLLITDLQLPQMDGIEVITRALAAQPDMAAILMTGHASVDSAVQALRHGAVDYVQKPFSFKALEAVVERALQMQRLKQANRLLQEQLRKRNVELEAVNQELDAFAARLAHDLRSPINNVRGIVAFVREELGAKVDADLQELLDRAVRSGDQALRMVSDLLDFARLGHGHLQLAPVALSVLMARCVEPLAAHLPAERCRIEIGELPTVMGHEGRSARFSSTCWTTPSSTPSPNRRCTSRWMYCRATVAWWTSASATTGSASIRATHGSCSCRFNGCIGAASSPAPAWAWPTSSASSSATGDGFGPTPCRARAPRSP